MRFLSRRRFLVGGLLAPLVLTLLSVVLPGTAEARCDGVNREVVSTLSWGGDVVASERPVSGTCDGNNLYRGEARSLKAYYTVVVYIQNGGVWASYSVPRPSGVYGPYQYNDNNSNSWMLLCVRNEAGTSYICGWGSKSVAYAQAPSQLNLTNLAQQFGHGVNAGF